MFNIVLYEPEIPPNTGNIMRLCVNTGCDLHLIEPLGFSISDKHLKRANLDYEMLSKPKTYKSFEDFLQQYLRGFDNHSSIPNPNNKTYKNLYFCSTKGSTCYTDIHFKPNDTFIFGPETRGLPQDLLDKYPAEQKIYIPMQANARSLNLSNAVAVIVYEAWRQQNFTIR